MTQRHRSFQTDSRPREPVTFDIDGEPFTASAQMPGSVLLEHTRRLTSPDEHVVSTELLDMWRDVLDTTDDVDEDGEPIEGTSEHARFRAFIDDPDRNVDIQLLGEILAWVLGKVTERPTPAPSPSANGQSTTGATSPLAPPPPPDQTFSPDLPETSSTGST